MSMRSLDKLYAFAKEGTPIELLRHLQELEFLYPEDPDLKSFALIAAAEGNRTEAEGAYKVAVKKVDMAASKGLIHKNNAAHKKSALTLKLNQMG